MADTAATTRPRPRPKPRPTAKSSSSSAPTASSSSTSQITDASASGAGSSTSGGGIFAAGRMIEVKDTDDMFIRNKNRSNVTWAKIEAINKEATKEDKDRESTDSEDENESPRSRHKRKKKDSSVPKWQRSEELVRMLSVEAESSDSDIEVTGSGHGSREHSTAATPRKRKRVRSKSLTPPPVPLAQIQNARQIVRDKLGTRHHSPNRSVDVDDMYLDDDPADNFVLQPELSALAKKIAANNRATTPGFDSGFSHTPTPAPGHSTSTDGVLVITVKYISHPLRPVTRVKQSQVYKINMGDTFRDLYDAVAEDMGVKSSNLIMTHNGRRFYPFVTPHTLRIFTDSVNMDAYEKETFEYMRTNPMTMDLPVPPTFQPAYSQPRTPSQLQPPGEVLDLDSDNDSDRGASTPVARAASISDDDEGPSNHTQSNAQEDLSESEGPSATKEKDTSPSFKLVCRAVLPNSAPGAPPASFTLAVRQSTTCAAIVKGFLKKAGLENEPCYADLFGNAAAAEPEPGPGARRGCCCCCDAFKGCSKGTSTGCRWREDGW
ncbi:hypothetical protein BJ165DRAFT_1129408 [Panaeolus papilionaceus]|nr:hypothetical protein BJ165DRAFT_1129408 [Panaeolus papilionaceus]